MYVASTSTRTHTHTHKQKCSSLDPIPRPDWPQSALETSQIILKLSQELQNLARNCRQTSF